MNWYWKKLLISYEVWNISHIDIVCISISFFYVVIGLVAFVFCVWSGIFRSNRIWMYVIPQVSFYNLLNWEKFLSSAEPPFQNVKFGRSLFLNASNISFIVYKIPRSLPQNCSWLRVSVHKALVFSMRKFETTHLLHEIVNNVKPCQRGKTGWMRRR